MIATPYIECPGALSDAVLQAARAAVTANAHYSIDPAHDVSPRNRDLMLLLDCLLDAALTTAAAIAENAWDEPCALPHHRITDAVSVANRIQSELVSCTGVPRRQP